jgi:L-alanine-DL-glutamate epimerase-like enolase superfamily enzyme
VAVAAGVQLGACTRNFLILEYPTDMGGIPWRQDLIMEPEQIVNGRMPLPDKPGLGVELNVKALVKHKAKQKVLEIPNYYERTFTIPAAQS